MSVTRPPLDYLATCSQMSLESVELSRLNLAANLRKEFQEILNEWIESEVDARLARSILEWRRAQDTAVDAPEPILEAVPAPPQFEQLAIAFLPESSAPPIGTLSECDPQPHHARALPPKRNKQMAPPQTKPRIRSFVGGRPQAQLADSGGHQRADRGSKVRKESRPTEKLLPRLIGPLSEISSRSMSLARAAAMHLGDADNLVESPCAKSATNRNSVAAEKYPTRLPHALRRTARNVVTTRRREVAREGPLPIQLSPRALHAQPGYPIQHLRAQRAG